MPVSNQTRRRLTRAALIAAPFASIALLGELASLASRFRPAAGVLVLVLVFGCGLVIKRRQRTAALPRPAAAPLPGREPAQLAA